MLLEPVRGTFDNAEVLELLKNQPAGSKGEAPEYPAEPDAAREAGAYDSDVSRMLGGGRGSTCRHLSLTTT